MRCFYWENGVTRPGVQIHERGKHKAVSLGVDPLSAGPRFLCLHRSNPPAIRQEGSREYIDDAYPVSMQIPGGDGQFFVLAQPHDKHTSDQRVLVHLSTFAPGVQGRATGAWRCVAGDAETIALGKLSGRSNSQWVTGLVRFSVGSAVRVTTEDASGDDFVIELTPLGLRTQKWTEYNVRRVLVSEGVIDQEVG